MRGGRMRRRGQVEEKDEDDEDEKMRRDVEALRLALE
jgi:hypothetical protein